MFLSLPRSTPLYLNLFLSKLDFVKQVERSGKRGLVVIIPMKEQIDEKTWMEVRAFYPQKMLDRTYVNRTLTELLNEQCVDVLDLTFSMLGHQKTLMEITVAR